MAEPCRIRPASVEDAAALAGLERRCFSDPWSAEAFRATLDTPGGAGFVAESADRIGYRNV